MTLQMNYQEKYEQGYDEGDRKRAIAVAVRMIEANKLSSEEIALYSGLILEQVLELEKEIITGIMFCSLPPIKITIFCEKKLHKKYSMV